MIKVIELFGGIGAPRKALERSKIDFEVVDYVEIDKYAVKSYNAIYKENYEPQDICKWDKDIECDLIFHGSPCQSFSTAGKNEGGDEGSNTRSSLMWETIRIVEKLRPKYVVWENVKNVLSKKHIHNFNKYIDKLDALGYKNFYKVLNAKDYGIPQNRERIFVVSIKDKNSCFKFPEKIELKNKLIDYIEKDVDKKFFLKDEQLKKILVSEKENLLMVKNATKKGFQTAQSGDSINLSYLESKTRRGRVGKQLSQTIQCNNNMAVAIGDSVKLTYPSTPKKRIRKDIVRTITTRSDEQGVFIE